MTNNCFTLMGNQGVSDISSIADFVKSRGDIFSLSLSLSLSFYAQFLDLTVVIEEVASEESVRGGYGFSPPYMELS